ncbi:MAG TPA: PIN domain-containing protein [Bdellovibrionota bacterium]|nr:PIN domain-containing protein [Bdellovibrionota bacterium]
MIAYLDSSVLLRVLLNQRDRFSRFSEIERPVASKLLKTECLRTLDRLRLNDLLTEDQHLKSLEELYSALDSVEFVEVSDAILDRAGSGFPVALGTLDAIHLVSAMMWREQNSFSLIFLTHDEVLAKAAKGLNFEVPGR